MRNKNYFSQKTTHNSIKSTRFHHLIALTSDTNYSFIYLFYFYLTSIFCWTNHFGPIILDQSFSDPTVVIGNVLPVVSCHGSVRHVMLLHSGVNFWEKFEEFFEQIGHLSDTGDTAGFTDGMHAQFRTPDVDSAHAQTCGLYWTDGGAAMGVVADNVILK